MAKHPFTSFSKTIIEIKRISCLRSFKEAGETFYNSSFKIKITNETGMIKIIQADEYAPVPYDH